MEEEVFNKALNELKEYAERRGMILVTEASSIKITKDITEEVEDCMLEAMWEEFRNAEETCRKSCGIRREEATEWQMKCLNVCLQCWKMTRWAECADRRASKLLEHLYAIETTLKTYGIWYYAYWNVDIGEKVLFTAEFKPPPTLHRKT